MRKILHFVFALSFLSAFSADVAAQDNDRVEVPIRSDKDFFNVINLGDNGALMMYGSARSSMGVTFYDTHLTQQWSNTLNLDPKSQYIDSFTDEGGVVYLLFGNDNRNAFEMMRISCNIGLIQPYVFTSLPNFEITEFKVKNQTVFLGGMIKREPVILTIQLGERTPRVISGGFRERATLQSLDFDADGNLLANYVLTKRRTSFMVIKEISDNGKILNQYTVMPRKGNTFINGKLFELDAEKHLLIGNFGVGRTSNGIPVSQGIYIVKGYNLPESQREVFYYPFTEFKSFFAFMSERRQEKIEKQAKKKKEKGSELRLDYKLLLHDIQKDDDGFLLVADVFNPILRTNNYYGYGSPMWGGSGFYNPYFNSPFFYRNYYMLNSWAWNPWMFNSINNNTYVDGFNYTHAFMVYFKNDGEVKWDNSIVYHDLQSYNLTEKISVKETPNAFYAAYTDDSKLSMVQLSEEGQITDDNTTTVKNANDAIKETQFSNASYWYGDNFLYWGYQKLKNDEEGKRKVFFMQKVSFLDSKE